LQLHSDSQRHPSTGIPISATKICVQIGVEIDNRRPTSDAGGTHGCADWPAIEIAPWELRLIAPGNPLSAAIAIAGATPTRARISATISS